MTDLEKLVAKTQNVLCIEEITTKTTYYNCFGDKINEDIKTTSSFYTFRKGDTLDDIGWIKGNEKDK